MFKVDFKANIHINNQKNRITIINYIRSIIVSNCTIKKERKKRERERKKKVAKTRPYNI